MMSTPAIRANTLEAAWPGCQTAADCRGLELAKAFGGRVFSIAKHITQDHEAAEDVVIETFLDAYSEEPEGDGWLGLATIAVRKSFAKLRRRGDRLTAHDPAADPCEDLVMREFAVWGDYDPQSSLEPATSVLEEGLRGLDAMCRTVFVLRDIEEMEIADIARIVGRSEAAVDVCLLRARLQLRESLARHMRLPQ